ncbi:hypothetical protein [Sphingomonas prati]|uniref:Uncharacterized protein n=1 Tax=Sphingomonas prati TaxID=1843237 RepID=A0A7W9BQ85_9SPHN|nr:hypothetical protein [Sphingomonas prati]MBB5727931.1 hypothetical protein [Sphingomonas prati]GGE81953.1 hypothetical protein GCM10011404_13250 [Sphingomonas prati]
MIALLALLLVTTPSIPADAQTCPGGPLFGFIPGTARLDTRTEEVIGAYIANINVPLWRSGWITVTPTVPGQIDGPARQLAERRKMTIARRLRHEGVDADRVRFAVLRFSVPGQDDADVYPSTLSTPRAAWEAHVPPEIAC